MGVFWTKGGGMAISLSGVVIAVPWEYISWTWPCGGVRSDVAGEGTNPFWVELGEKFEIKVLSVRKGVSKHKRLNPE